MKQKVNTLSSKPAWKHDGVSSLTLEEMAARDETSLTYLAKPSRDAISCKATLPYHVFTQAFEYRQSNIIWQ